MPDITKNYPKPVVDKAFWLQEKIYRDGLTPVGFMAHAKTYAETHGARVVSEHIKRQVR